MFEFSSCWLHNELTDTSGNKKRGKTQNTHYHWEMGQRSDGFVTIETGKHQLHNHTSQTLSNRFTHWLETRFGLLAVVLCLWYNSFVKLWCFRQRHLNQPADVIKRKREGITSQKHLWQHVVPQEQLPGSPGTGGRFCEPEHEQVCFRAQQ